MKRHFFAPVLLILALAAALLAAMPHAGAEVLVFDMGTPTSLVHPGARQGLAGHADWPSSEPQYWSFSVTVGAESWPFRISAPGYGGEYRMEHHTFDVVSDGSI